MKLNQAEVRTVHYLLGTYLHMASRQRWRVLPSVAALADRINGVSSWRHETGCAGTNPPGSEGMEYVGTRIAAQRLGWSMKKVARNAERLGGRLIGGRWLFPADTIAAIAEQENQ